MLLSPFQSFIILWEFESWFWVYENVYWSFPKCLLLCLYWRFFFFFLSYHCSIQKNSGKEASLLFVSWIRKIVNWGGMGWRKPVTGTEADHFISALSHLCVPTAICFGLSSRAVLGKSHLLGILLIIQCAFTRDIAGFIFPWNVTHKVEGIIWTN